MRKKKSPEAVEADGQKTLKLDYPQTFKVGFAFAIIMLFWSAYDFVVPLLLEHAYGLSNAMRGFIMGLDNLLSLFMLPLFGKISDKANGKLVKKWGRRTPFIVIGTIASVVLMVFVPIATMKQQEKGMAKKAEIEAQRNDDDFMNELLGNGTTTRLRQRTAIRRKKARRIIATSITLNKTKLTTNRLIATRSLKSVSTINSMQNPAFWGSVARRILTMGKRSKPKRKTAKSCLSGMLQTANLIKA